MTAARQAPHELPLLPTLLCLLASGVVSSLLVSSVLAGRSYPSVTNRDPLFTFLAVAGLVAALVGAVVVRALLNRVVGCDVSYGAAFIALAAGSLVSDAFVWATSAAVQGSGSPGAVPTGGVLFSFAPTIAGMAVSYWILQRGVRDGVSARPSDTPAPLPAWELDGASYDELVSAARETSLGLVDTVSRANPEDVPGLIGERLPTLQEITTSLENATPPIAVPARVHQRLIDGMRQLQDDLVDAAANAAGNASLGGARYRWELSLSPGLKLVKEVLTELAGLGVGTSW